MTHRWIALGLLALAATAHADVQVKFVNPEKFTDIRDNNGFRQPDVLKDIEAYLVAEAGKRLPGRDVCFEVTDVDLAGEVEPFGRRGQWLRVMRTVTSPAMELKYEIREGDKVVRKGEAKLRELDYQNTLHGISDSDPLRYEKQMLSHWMQREFSPELATAR